MHKAAEGAWLVCSRLTGRVGEIHPGDEERFLEMAYPSEKGVETDDLWNWYFRALAFYKKNGRYEEFDSLGKTLSLEGRPNEITKANIGSEVARVSLLRDDYHSAYNLFHEVLLSSVQAFHLRGVSLTALFLAEVALRLRDFKRVTQALCICQQFEEQVSRKEEQKKFQQLRLDLENQIGTDEVTSLFAQGIGDLLSTSTN